MFSAETIEYCKKNKSILLLFVLWTIRLFFLLQGNAGGVAINKYVVVQLIAELGIAFALLCRGFQWGVLFSAQPIAWFSLLYFWGMLSVFWGAFPLMGFYFAFQNIIMLAALYHLASSCKDFLQLERYYIFTNIFILLIFIFRGIFEGGFHSVTYSTVGGLLLVYCAAEYDKKARSTENVKMLKWGMAIGGLVLILSTSSGAMVSVAAGMFALALFAKQPVLKIVAFAFLSAILISYLTGAMEWVISFLFPGKSMASIVTAHGRSVVWNMIWEKFYQRPWLGWGYASVERILDIYCVDAHNSYVGVAGSLGYIGCVLLILAMLSAFLYTFHNIKIPGFRGLFAAIICGLVNSNTSNFLASKAGFQALSFQMILILAVVYFSMSEQDRKKNKIENRKNLYAKLHNKAAK